MAKYVIDIPQDIYELCKRDKLHYEQAELLENQVANGTPLPKGHGRLIDADLLKTRLIYESDIGAEIETYGTDDVIKRIFDDAPTIIEADKDK